MSRDLTPVKRKIGRTMALLSFCVRPWRRTSSHNKLLLFLILSLSFSKSSLAQDVYRHAKPWRRQVPSSSSSSRAHTVPPRVDYSSHFIDLEQAKADKRARLWTVDFKTRKIGQLSWTSRLVWTNILLYAVQVFRPGFTQWGIQLPEKILAGQELRRLITPVFLHGGLGHIFTNMYSLNAVGPDVEKLFGPGRYLATYLAAGVAGNILSATQSPNPSLGASGAVFGIVGAYYVFLNRHDWLLGRAGEGMEARIIQTLGMNILIGFMNPMIDNWGHMGGAIGGAAMAYFFGPRLYLADKEDGGRLIIDKPIIRLPRQIETIPGRISDGYRRITRRAQVEKFKGDRETPPWQKRQQYRRPATPNKPIKPDTSNL